MGSYKVVKSLPRCCVSNTLGFRKECDQEIPFIGRCRYKKQEMVAVSARVIVVKAEGCDQIWGAV